MLKFNLQFWCQCASLCDQSMKHQFPLTILELSLKLLLQCWQQTRTPSSTSSFKSQWGAAELYFKSACRREWRCGSRQTRRLSDRWLAYVYTSSTLHDTPLILTYLHQPDPPVEGVKGYTHHGTLLRAPDSQGEHTELHPWPLIPLRRGPEERRWRGAGVKVKDLSVCSMSAAHTCTPHVIHQPCVFQRQTASGCQHRHYWFPIHLHQRPTGEKSKERNGRQWVDAFTVAPFGRKTQETVYRLNTGQLEKRKHTYCKFRKQY